MNIIKNTPNSKAPFKSIHFLNKKLSGYLTPFLEKLESHLDHRLVKTFSSLVVAILAYRNRMNGLLLSELGAYITNGFQPEAGTKRISNLLRSKNWEASLIKDFIFEQACQRAESLAKELRLCLIHWDDSKIEKSESWKIEGLCSVHSSKGQRLTKIKPGYYAPPQKRICVPGFKWSAMILSSLREHPSVVQMEMWTTKGKFKEHGCNLLWRGLKAIQERLGSLVVHVMDRGYACEQTLTYLFRFDQNFIIRWKKNVYLSYAEQLKKVYQISIGLKNKSSKFVLDKERKCLKRVMITWTKVAHPEFPDKELTLVVIRDKKRPSPMYLLTSLKVDSKQQAWNVFHSYMNRWKIEEAFRFNKSEMGVESIRLWFWDNREKLMAIVMLCYDFLLTLLQKWEMWVRMFIQTWCHRTGNRCRNVSTPIYRLRLALSNLLIRWLHYCEMASFVNMG